MLSADLKKSDCASCKFCCSIRRQSLWETPVFSKQIAQKLKELYPFACFRPAGKESVTIDLSMLYKTDDPEEEVPCPFLDKAKGCSLPPELKPFDCSIWPFRAVRIENKIVPALTPTCPAINKVPEEKIYELLENGLAQKILDYAKNNPDIIKDDKLFPSFIKFFR